MDTTVASPVLALDLGTSSMKALVVTSDGRVIARSEEPIETISPEPGIAEQDALAALDAASRAVRSVAVACDGRPQSLVLACAMHGVVPIDGDARPLARLRTWADARGQDVATELRGSGAWRSLQQRTGTPVHASSPMCKLAAMGRHEPELFARASAFVSLKELLLRRWCDAPVLDASLASATGLRDSARAAWDQAALAFAGVEASRLSELVSPRHVVTGWRVGVAAELGLDPRTPVVVGASDGCLANLGLDAVRRGAAAASFGTSAAVRVAVGRFGVPADSGLFCYLLDDGAKATLEDSVWIVGGAVNDCGNAVQWLAELLFGDVEPAQRVPALLDSAATVGDGARGVRFAPGLGGQRFPDFDATARAAISGLAFAHGRAEFARALLEGIASQTGGIVKALRACHIAVDSLQLGGGLARAPVFRGILATRADAALLGGDEPDATALGAARLARAALDGSALPGAETLR